MLDFHPNEIFEILLVDDVKDNLLALRSLLERDNLKIFQAQNGTEALELMMKHDFCLALLDVQMPGMNGFELAELMRGSNKTKNIPIIFVTAAADNENYVFKGYESGAVDFLRKPLDPHAVKSKVKVFLEINHQKRELEKQVSELQQTRDEQVSLLAQLRKAKRELELAVQVREDFMSIASHELKTPLTTLKLHTQMRQRNMANANMASFTPEKLKKMFDTDNKQLERLNRLIDDMLDVSRISTGKLSMNLEEMELSSLIQDVVDRNFELFKTAGCEVNVNACKTIHGRWDKFRIEQVVTNLLTNALRYGAGKPIKVAVTYEHERAVIVIEDHGVGIAENNLQRIFQRFERATISELSGLGLGLYIANQIVEAHHGEINVESQLGVGSAFTIILPLTL